MRRVSLSLIVVGGEIALDDVALGVDRELDDEIPLTQVAAALPTLTPAEDPYPVAVQVDGARSHDPGIGFRLVP